ncbi:MAG: hypothetical protein QOG87_372 [Actinomycetota bacterium]|jgi:hypothetical protein
MRRVTRTIADDDIVTDDAVVRREIVRAPWSPAQIVALVIGAILTVLGGVALARTGLNFDVDTTRTTVAGLEHTALLAVIELIVGLVLIGAASVPGAPRGTMRFVGVSLLLLGIIIAIEPSGTHRALGTSTSHGWFWAILGVILLASAMASPVIYDADRRAYVRRGTLIHR